MISTDQIQKLSRSYQTTELNVRREYYQHVFLSYLYQQEATDGIFFKGGTALRILYNSPRFSEDLDFTAIHSDLSSLEKIILETLSQMGKENIQVGIQESKQTSGGYLAHLDFQNGHMVRIQIEVSFREKNASGELITVAGDFIPPYPVMSLARDQLVSEKLRALQMRQKPRDYYDLYVMLRSNLLSAEKKQLLSDVLPLIKNSTINFEKELKIFLPKSHWAIIRDFKNSLVREVKRYV